MVLISNNVCGNYLWGLDFVISEGSKYGLRLILSLVNNWNDFGGKKQYVKWAEEGGHYMIKEDDFFSHHVVKQYYKNHVKVKRAYMSIGLRTLRNGWEKSLHIYVKSIDGKHILEVGLEGFDGETMPERKTYNPGYSIGTDFISNNQIPETDFATIHLYPEIWLKGSSGEAQATFVDKWVQIHSQDSNYV
ncbi:mannan endo-1,4-beta-mannosidase 4 [Quillaja saponaria]|uniref:Mannan endo-1,4-beta-mannosidase 4 n=1 Tax=Quillaja saponaria TaxID=32244 RepID=A0AAD7Q1J9_QUISA|nr:mannan endo-1,4-beta-mannosidase 4 [Quillaja saponaria]